MKRIHSFQINSKGNVTIINFEANKNIVMVKAESDNEIKIKRIQNSIVDTLLPVGKTAANKQGGQELTLDNPVVSSSLYLYGNGIRNIQIYESEGVNLLNLYPKSIDVPLEENYYLDTVSVFNSSDGYSEYSLYTSLDGKNFDRVAIKNNHDICDSDNGDVYELNGKEARIIRIYYEYNSESPEVAFEKVMFSGRKSHTPVIDRETVNICSFEDSEYNVSVSDKETIDEVYGIIERRLGAKYRDWFKFTIGEKKKYDYFNIERSDKKIEITGNCGVSLAMGLNYYLKYFCKVSISQVGDQTAMPNVVVFPEYPVYRETKAKIRYAYNYCTLSYTSAFWGDDEWQKELDWLALNGVNAVLDITGQEEVWRRFLIDLGYNHNEAKEFLTGPANYAWFCMANEFSVGGPLNESWFEMRVNLARKNHLKMKKLGMQPILQGYSGMVPVDIKRCDGTAEIVPQGTWCALQRPAMLKTDSETYSKYAEKFYMAQKYVFGNESIYYAADAFHEGGITGEMSPRAVSKIILSEMLKSNPNAVWVIQSWQNNPTSELLAGIEDVEDGKKHALILDLYAEKTPHFNNGNSGNPYYGYTKEFNDTPWIYCMLNNFGGRLGLHGHLDNMARDIPLVLNNCSCFCGIGITCEASENNPVLYDFLFESVWHENAKNFAQPTDIKNWLHSYAERRYGAKSKAAEKAWDILAETVYKAEFNMLGQGAPESMVNARPKFNLNKASTWGNAIIGYDTDKFKESARLLLEDYDKLSASDGYIYDIVSVFEQFLSNCALKCYDLMSDAYNKKNVSELKACGDKFIKIADNMAKLTANCEYYRLDRFINLAKKISASLDDFSKRLYVINAKQQITVSGPYCMSEDAGEHDYANRQWSGLISRFYKIRWERYLKEKLNELEGISYEKNINWFELEWSWCREDDNCSDEKKSDDLYGFLTDLIDSDRIKR